MKSNCHTHTTYCDGKNKASEMADKAVELGFASLGFSGHCPMNFKNDWAMSQEGLENYYNEITALKEQYKDKIDILCGIELDSDFQLDKEYKFDYAIASVHQIHKDDRIYSIDYSAEELARCVKNEYDGSWNKMAEEYYKSVSDFVLSVNADIVGHIDLITKFNNNFAQFNENDADYQSSAVSCVDRIIANKPEIVFEVNTGAMFRCGNERPYPAAFILKRICQNGGRITVTSDAHQPDALDFAFDKARAYCKNCGFDKIYHLTKDGFVPEYI